MGKEEMKLGWRESGLKEKYLSQWEIRNVLTAGLCNCANCQKRGDRVGTEWGHPPVSLSLSTKQSVLKFV